MISIVIPVKNGGDDLRRCLSGIAAQRVQDDVEVVSYADDEFADDEFDAAVDVDLAGEPHDDGVVLPDLGFDELDGVGAEVEGADDADLEIEPEPAPAAAEIETDDAPAAEVDEDAEPDEFLSQLANLSPKAAAAIEATASESEATRNRPSGEADEEINRNLLLKFLSSSKP